MSTTIPSRDISIEESYFNEPYVFDPQDMFQVEVTAREDSPGDYIVLGGYVIERRGMPLHE